MSCLRVSGATCHRALQLPAVTQSETPHPVWPDRLLHSGAQSGGPTALGLGVRGLVLEVGVRGSGVRGRGSGLYSRSRSHGSFDLLIQHPLPLHCSVFTSHFIFFSPHFDIPWIALLIFLD